MSGYLHKDEEETMRIYDNEVEQWRREAAIADKVKWVMLVAIILIGLLVWFINV